MQEKSEQPWEQLLKAQRRANQGISGVIFGSSEEFPHHYEFKVILEKSKMTEARYLPQDGFLKAYNHHREAHGLPLVDMKGCCHGLTLVWLDMMGKGKGDRFRELYHRVLKTTQTAPQTQNEKFYKKIDKAQNPQNYNPNVSFKDIDIILGVPEVQVWEWKDENRYTEGYTRQKLQKVLEEAMQNYDMICISSFTSYSHTIGMFIQKDKIKTFDCNGEDGIDGEKELSREYEHFTSLQAANWVKNCFYTKFKLPTPADLRMKITTTGIKSSLLLQKKKENTGADPQPTQSLSSQDSAVNMPKNRASSTGTGGSGTGGSGGGTTKRKHEEFTATNSSKKSESELASKMPRALYNSNAYPGLMFKQKTNGKMVAITESVGADNCRGVDCSI